MRAPLTLLLLLALPAAAQDGAALTPGNDALDLAYIQPGTTTYTITVVQGDMRMAIGTYVQTLTVDEDAGLIQNVSAMDMMGQKFADTTRASWPDLAARYHASTNPERTLRFAVEDGMLAGEHTPADGTTEAFEMSVDGPVYDSAWLDDIASALPLAEGFSTTVSAYAYEAGGVADYALRVLGSEKLAVQGKAPVDVWVVEATRPGEDQLPRFYLTKDGHNLVRIRILPQPGVEVLIDAQ